MLGKLKVIAVLALLFAFAVPDVTVHSAATSSLSGSLYIVNTAGQSVTVKDALGKTTTLTITRKTKFRRNNKGARLNGLVLGDQVTVVFDSANNATQITANGPTVSTVQGGVRSVTSGTGIVQIVKNSVSTGGQTRIIRNGKFTSLKSLTLLDTVTSHVTKASSGKSASTSSVFSALDIQAEGPEESEIHGTIVTVTPANPGDPSAIPPVPPSPAMVTIHPADGVSPDITLIITDTTLIELDDHLGTFADLQVGMSVEAEYDPITLAAFRIESDDEEEDAEIEGTITAIDLSCTLVVVPPALPLPCTVTITPSVGSPVILIVDATTKIERDDAPALLTDLKVGDPVEAEYNIVTMVAKEIEVELEDGEGGGED
jgi:hypothetical protein